MIRSHKIRQAAWGQPCHVDGPTCKHMSSETVVWAHSPFRAEDGGGVALKVHDIFGCFACANCHDLLDGRVQIQDYDRDAIYRLFHRAMKRSWLTLIELGVIRL